MYKAVIYDFDGTIAKTPLRIHAHLNAGAEKYGIRNISLRRIMKLRDERDFKILRQQGLSWYKLHKIYKMNKEITEKIKQEAHNIKIYDGIEEVLLKSKEKGYLNGIVTRNIKETVEIILRENKIADLFDFIYGRQNIVKEAARRFNKVPKLMNAIKERKLNRGYTFYVGDEVVDI
ncbi:HAD hydrolase-like protein, partial [Candidatus Woesearchaeota archaeon]|nr:HAD hydrolase-like protein [Candidatus Woesearchaeota archaeon]